MYLTTHEGEPPTGDFHPHTHAPAGRTPGAQADRLASASLRRAGGLAGACVPGMSQCLEVKVLCPAKWRRRTREAQGRHREVGSEGSVERMRGARNTNLIRGVTYLGRVGTQPPSPPSTEGMFCKSSVYAQTVLRLTPGELLGALGSGVPRKLAEGDESLLDRSAAVSRGHSTWQTGKARTVVKGSILRPGVPHARPGSRVESESGRRTPWQSNDAHATEPPYT